MPQQKQPLKLLQKAAKEARETAKRKKEEEEARKLAEAKAAEEAELDAALLLQLKKPKEKWQKN